MQIVVEDNGAGIPPEQLDKLFSPFVSTKKGRGTGLGLPVSQKILKEHGGRIVTSRTAPAAVSRSNSHVMPAAEGGGQTAAFQANRRRRSTLSCRRTRRR